VRLGDSFQYWNCHFLLCIGVIIEILKRSGIVDVAKAKLKMYNNGLINECIFNLSIFTVISSNPGEEYYLLKSFLLL